MSRSILVVRATHERLLLEILSAEHSVDVVTDAASALRALERGLRPELIVAHANLTGMSGIALCTAIRAEPRFGRVRVVLLGPARQEGAAFDAGATEYVVTPFERRVLVARVAQCLERATTHVAVDDPCAASYAEVMALLAETRRPTGSLHLKRVQFFVRVTARELMFAQDFGALDTTTIEHLVQGSALHDVGMWVVPDAMLEKAEALSRDEQTLLRRHPMAGEEIVSAIQRRLARPDPVLEVAKEIAGGHHERWDGGGYPRGCIERQTPAAARIVAVADAYDAMTSPRPYRRAWTHAEAIERLIRDAGAAFDPAVVAAFVKCEAEAFDAGATLRCVEERGRLPLPGTFGVPSMLEIAIETEGSPKAR